MLRYLRIAIAVFFALLAIGFVALWVRSHKRHEVFLPNARFGIASNRGIVVFVYNGYPLDPKLGLAYPAYLDNPLSLTGPDGWVGETIGGFGIRKLKVSKDVNVYVPHWFLAACSLALVALFAFKRAWRFSVLTILIATTLVAATLGLGVYLTH